MRASRRGTKRTLRARQLASTGTVKRRDLRTNVGEARASRSVLDRTFTSTAARRGSERRTSKARPRNHAERTPNRPASRTEELHSVGAPAPDHKPHQPGPWQAPRARRLADSIESRRGDSEAVVNHMTETHGSEGSSHIEVLASGPQCRLGFVYR